MKRQLPLYLIDGTDFLVDINWQELRQANQPDNVISFVKDMTDMGTYYALKFDRNKKNYAYHSYQKQDVIEVAIPAMTVLDPEGMAEKFGLTVEQLKGKRDFDLFVNPGLVAERKQGNLPVLRIDGYDFRVNVAKHELQPCDGLTPPIPMRLFNFADDGQRHHDYYDIISRKLVEIDLKLTELPENVMQIKIPNVLYLDPVGVANRYGIDENFVLRRYPIQKELKAELIPLDLTDLKTVVNYNRLALEREHTQRQGLREKIRHRQQPKI